MDAKTLTTQPIPKLLRDIAIPFSLGMLFNTLYNIVDTYYAGLISTEALSALSTSSFLFFFIIGLAYGISSAITSLIGHAYGKKRFKFARILAKKGVAFIMMASVVFGSVGYSFASELLLLIGSKPEYHDLALAFIQVILLGIPFFFANFALNSVLMATGDTKSYRNTLIFGFFANIALNPLLIYGYGIIPAFHIAGIALATVLVQCMSAGYLLYRCLQTQLIDFSCWVEFYPDRRLYARFFSQGLPIGTNLLMMSLGSLIALYYVSSYGYQAVAGYGIGYRIEQLMLLPALGISSATLSLVSNNFGAKEYARIRLIMKHALLYGYTLSLFGMVFLTITASWLIRQFDTNTLVIEYGSAYISIMLFLFCGYVTHFVCVSTLQGIQKPVMIFYVGLFRQIIAPSLVYYTLVSYLGLSFIWMWVGLGCIVYSSALFLVWHTYRQLPRE